MTRPIVKTFFCVGVLMFSCTKEDAEKQQPAGINPLTTLQTGYITTIAGTGQAGFTGDGGSATTATLNEPNGLDVDSLGNVFVAEGGTGLIRKISSSGILTTIAGVAGQSGDTGDGGPAKAALLGWPTDVTLDKSGNLYMTDGSANVIRKVAQSTGMISTIAGTFLGGFNIIDPNRYFGDGGPATASHLNLPDGIAVGKTGNVFFVDVFNGVVRKIDGATGVITTIGGNVALDPGTYGGDGGPATQACLFNATKVALDGSENVYLSHQDDNAIRKIDAHTGVITTIAGIGGNIGYSGDGGPATSAKLNNPQGIALDEAGNIYIADTGNNVIRKVDATTGTITTIAGSGSAGYSGDGAPATSAKLNGPTRIAIDGKGVVYIADAGNSAIRVVKQ